MWDLPRPGLEPMSPALAGRFSTTAPPGKPNTVYYYYKTGNDLKSLDGVNKLYVHTTESHAIKNNKISI